MLRRITFFKPYYCSGCCTRFKSTFSKDPVSNPDGSSLPDSEKAIHPFRVAVEEQGSIVKRLIKEATTSSEELDKAVIKLKNKKQLLEAKLQELSSSIPQVNKVKLDDLIKQRFYYDQSFSIYGGVTGLYDFGPAGCAVKNHLLQDWRQFFVLADGMLEVDCPVLTPEAPLQASGHVEKFTDYLISDSLTGESYRADHLIRQSLESLAKKKGKQSGEAKQALAGLGSLDGQGLQGLIDRFGIAAPGTGNALTQPREFNLMFDTAAGADSRQQGWRHRMFLRPETAQGIFTNFRRLLDFNRGRLPMAVAQVGQSFRNEVQPRSGLLRLREFALAEIEHFYDPEDRRLRFRQHPPCEMAHYAADCWDAECLLTDGCGRVDWVECVGCADRAAYDLSRHSEASGESLVAARTATGGTSRSFTPSVVEPSFGVGRLLSAILEHNYRQRPGRDEQMTYLSLPAWLAPYHCALLPMNGGSAEMRQLIRRLHRRLAVGENLAGLVDADSRGVSIGKRYARCDQLGVPFAVTVDYDSVAEIDRVPGLVRQLVGQRITWSQVMDTEAVFQGQTATKGNR
uniref:glycine--tRNA ligase n=1 Tax=Macrostomum lignano TaxID=282301 RepID=A0A1I8GBV7_9PLAT